VSSSPTDAAVVVDVTMPQMGVSVAEGTVIAWRKQVGDAIAADETICEVSTDKIDVEVPSPANGTVSELVVRVDETVPVGAVLARIATGGSAPALAPVAPAPPPAAAAAPPAPVAPPPATRDRHRFSPVVARIAAEHGLDLDAVPGTGRGGRVRKQDVLAHLAANGATPAAEPPLHIESPYRPEPSPGPAAGDVTEPLSRMRRSIGEHMVRSLHTAAHCTTIVEVDMVRIELARRAAGLTYLPLVARCVIAALREHPQLNATLAGDVLTRHADVNLGIAVALEDEGLIVPVIQRAQELSHEGLGERIVDLARRARAGEITPDEVRGGTFTITNPGAFGAIAATPIINQPQVAILDLEAVVKRPVVLTDAEGNDSIAIRPIANLCMSWDHRALDGVLAARFLAAVKRHVEGWTGA